MCSTIVVKVKQGCRLEMFDARRLVQVLFAPTLLTWFLHKILFILVRVVLYTMKIVWLGSELLACVTATHRKVHVKMIYFGS